MIDSKVENRVYLSYLIMTWHRDFCLTIERSVQLFWDMGSSTARDNITLQNITWWSKAWQALSRMSLCRSGRGKPCQQRPICDILQYSAVEAYGKISSVNMQDGGRKGWRKGGWIGEEECYVCCLLWFHAMLDLYIMSVKVKVAVIMLFRHITSCPVHRFKVSRRTWEKKRYCRR